MSTWVIGGIGITGVMGLTAIEITALCNGIDGTLMSMVVGGISGIIGISGGYIIKALRTK